MDFKNIKTEKKRKGFVQGPITRELNWPNWKCEFKSIGLQRLIPLPVLPFYDTTFWKGSRMPIHGHWGCFLMWSFGDLPHLYWSSKSQAILGCKLLERYLGAMWENIGSRSKETSLTDIWLIWNMFQSTRSPHTPYLRTEQYTPTPHSRDKVRGSFCQ